MKRKILSLLALVALALTAFCGCAVKATQEELGSLSGFEFENPMYEGGYPGVETDEGFEIDGRFDEKEWGEVGSVWTFAHSSGTESNPITMTTKSYLGQKGVYVAFSVKDTAVYYSADRKASGNTSVEIYMSAYGQTEWNGNAFRISVVPTGTDTCITEMRTYRDRKLDFGDGEKVDLNWVLWDKAHLAGSHINGVGINSNFNAGYDIELFVPYESLGLSERPPAVQYMTAFYHVESEATDADNTWTKCNPTSGTTAFSTWLVADNEEIDEYSVMADKMVVCDEYMTLDGELSEEEWTSAETTGYTAGKPQYGKEAEISVKTHFGDRGLYVGLSVEDGKVYATETRDVKLNSGFELWLQSAAAEKTDGNSMQLRVDALGGVTKWKYNESSANWKETYFKSRAAVALHGCEENEDGTIASDDAQGFAVEIFIPWSEFSFDAEAGVALYPAYVRATDNENLKNTESEAWQYLQIASQTAAKTQSLKSLFRFTENGCVYTLSAKDVVFTGADLGGDGSYTFTVELTKAPDLAPINGALTAAAAAGAETSLPEGMSLVGESGGEYTFKIAADSVDDFTTARRITFSLDGARTEISVRKSPIVYDGKIDENDAAYAEPFSFYASKITDSEVIDMEGTIYGYDAGDGFALGVVFDSDYIDCNDSSTSGNYGGGIEISVGTAQAAAGGGTRVVWRIYPDGTARVGVNKNVPETARGDTFPGASSWGIASIAGADGAGYNKMTAEFFLPYDYYGVNGADELYIAIGLNATKKSDVTTYATVWLNGTGTKSYVPAASLTAFEMKDAACSLVGGEGTFRLTTDIEGETYVKGAVFEGAEVTEEDFGVYRVRSEASVSLTAKKGSRTATVECTAEAAPQLDGAIGENEYAGLLKEYSMADGDYAADVKVYYKTTGASVYLAFDVRETGAAKYVKDTPSGNQGTAGINFAVASEGFARANYYRAYATGKARIKQNFGGKAFGAPNSDVSEFDYLCGSVRVENGQADDISAYVLEWRVDYADYGVNGADELYFLFGWINGNQADRGFSAATGAQFNIVTNDQNNGLFALENYFTVEAVSE